jgi:hypothetical protein
MSNILGKHTHRAALEGLLASYYGAPQAPSQLVGQLPVHDDSTPRSACDKHSPSHDSLEARFSRAHRR